MVHPIQHHLVGVCSVPNTYITVKALQGLSAEGQSQKGKCHWRVVGMYSFKNMNTAHERE